MTLFIFYIYRAAGWAHWSQQVMYVQLLSAILSSPVPSEGSCHQGSSALWMCHSEGRRAHICKQTSKCSVTCRCFPCRGWKKWWPRHCKSHAVFFPSFSPLHPPFPCHLLCGRTKLLKMMGWILSCYNLLWLHRAMPVYTSCKFLPSI